MREDLPDIRDLPIPDDARPDRRWSPLMLEIAAHIGPPATLRFCDAFGGREIRISRDAARRQFAPVLTDDQGARFAAAFGGERIDVPVAKNAILAARRAGILAAVRSKKLTIGEAAVICRTPRKYLSKLVNGTLEGTGSEPVVPLPAPSTDPRQLDLLTLLDE